MTSKIYDIYLYSLDCGITIITKNYVWGTSVKISGVRTHDHNNPQIGYNLYFITLSSQIIEANLKQTTSCCLWSRKEANTSSELHSILIDFFKLWLKKCDIKFQWTLLVTPPPPSPLSRCYSMSRKSRTTPSKLFMLPNCISDII